MRTKNGNRYTLEVQQLATVTPIDTATRPATAVALEPARFDASDGMDLDIAAE